MNPIFKEIIFRENMEHFSTVRSFELYCSEKAVKVCEVLCVEKGTISGAPGEILYKTSSVIGGMCLGETKDNEEVIKIMVNSIRGATCIGTLKQWDDLWQYVQSSQITRVTRGDDSRLMEKISNMTLHRSQIPQVFPHRSPVTDRDAMVYMFFRNIWKAYLHQAFYNIVNNLIDLQGTENDFE